MLAMSVTLATALPSAAVGSAPHPSAPASQGAPVDARPDRRGPIITVAPVGSRIAAPGAQAAALRLRRTAPAPTIETLEKVAAAARAVATKRANEAAAAAKIATTLTKQANDAAKAATTRTGRARARVLEVKAAAARAEATRLAKVARISARAASAAEAAVTEAKKRAGVLTTPPAPVTPPAPPVTPPAPPVTPPAPSEPVAPPITPSQPISPPAPAQTFCERRVAQTWLIQPRGAWTVKCVGTVGVSSPVPGMVVLGVTYPDSRLIELDQDFSDATVEWVMHHELGHAFSIDNLTDRQRTYFAGLPGLNKADFWDDSDYWTMPAEAWANTQAKCVGLKLLDSRLTLSCDTLAATQAYAG